MALCSAYLNSKILPRFSPVISHYLSGRNVCSHTKDSFQYCQLVKRGVLRVSGEDSVKLLQGLVTNNVELFHQDTTLKTMYSMVLNAQGRVLYDILLYKDKTSTENPSFLIECDKSALTSLTKLIKIYKLRSKVVISGAEDIVPWVLFNPSDTDSPLPDLKSHSNLISSGKDPRISELGCRVLLSQGVGPAELLEGVSEGNYETHRVKLGVCEGVDEIKPGIALPLEFNLDYINGVSFQKGCYIGQELTARTHHTGIIRKRVMPFTFNSPELIMKLEHGAAIKTSAGKSSGKLSIVYGSYGLVLMRVAMLCDNKHYMKDNEGHDVELCPYIPKWWPKEEQSE